MTCPSCGRVVPPLRAGKGGQAESARAVLRCRGCGCVLRESFGKLYPVDPPLPPGGRKPEEPGASEPPLDPLGELASDRGLPFVENAPDVAIVPWANRFALGVAIVSGIILRLSPGWGESFELSPGNHGVLRFLTHALLPARGAGLALSDLYLLVLFGGAVEEAVGTPAYVAVYLTASALGGWFSLRFLPHDPVRGFTAAVVAMSCFFCLSYPNARIGFRFGFPGQRSPVDTWVRLPPLVWLMFWFFLHLGMRLLAIDGLPEKSDFFFLAGPWAGGMVVGVLTWLICNFIAPSHRN